MKESITKTCNAYGMQIKFVGTTAFVNTVVGEWFFDFSYTNIQLHHKNEEVRLDSNGHSTGYYHIQNKNLSKDPMTFKSANQVLDYIKRHEHTKIRRLIEADNNHI